MKVVMATLTKADDYSAEILLTNVQNKEDDAIVSIEFNDQDDIEIKTSRIGALRSQCTPSEIVTKLMTIIEGIQTREALESIADAFDVGSIEFIV